MIWVPVLRMAMRPRPAEGARGASAMVIAGAAGASAGGRMSSLLLTPGVLRAGEAIVAPRAVSIRLPFAADRQDCGRGRPGPTGPDRGDR